MTALETALEAVSSSGRSTSEGTIAARAGSNSEASSAIRTSRTSTIAGGASAATAAAIARQSSARPRSLAAITRSRGYRSAKVAAKGETIAVGAIRAKPTSPTRAGPPAS